VTTRALLVVAGVVPWAVAMAVYFHETHVKYTCYAAQAPTCRGRTARNRMPGRRGRLVFPGRGLAVIAPRAGAPSLHMTASEVAFDAQRR